MAFYKMTAITTEDVYKRQDSDTGPKCGRADTGCADPDYRSECGRADTGHAAAADRLECSRAGTGQPDTAAGRTDAVNARR